MALRTLNLNVQSVLAATTVGAAVILGTYWYQKKRKNAIPTEWEPVGKVKSLYMYPLKSGRRMEIDTAQCTEYGFRLNIQSEPYLRDRCLLVYNESNREFRTARTHPKILLVSVTPNDHNSFSLTAPGMEKIRIQIPNLRRNSKSDKVMMWENTEVFSKDCGDEAAKWLSRFILGNESGLRLGFHDGLHRTDITKTHKPFIDIHSKLGNSSTGMFSDLTSYMLMNQSSVDDLARRMPPDTDITINSFRPNIVVEGEDLAPYAEDNWDCVKIGRVVLRNVKPCTRCMLTTIDPETAIRSPQNEPLKTLKTYRKLKVLRQIDLEGDSPVLGIQMGLERPGDITVGDTVYIGKSNKQ